LGVKAAALKQAATLKQASSSVKASSNVKASSSVKQVAGKDDGKAVRILTPVSV